MRIDNLLGKHFEEFKRRWTGKADGQFQVRGAALTQPKLHLCGLPEHLQNSIISCLGVRDRMQLRLTCSMMEDAVANSDFLESNSMSQIAFRTETKPVYKNGFTLRAESYETFLCVVFDEGVILRAHPTSFHNYVQWRHRLFRRAFLDRVMLTIDASDEAMDVVERMLERCRIKTLVYTLREGEYNSRIFQFLEARKNLELNLITTGIFVDRAFLLTLSRPCTMVHYGGIERTIPEYLFVDLVKQGHSMDTVPVDAFSFTSSKILAVLELIASTEHRQWLRVHVLQTQCEMMLANLGIRKHPDGFVVDRPVEKVCLISGEKKLQFEYDGALVCVTDLSARNLGRYSIYISNYHHLCDERRGVHYWKTDLAADAKPTKAYLAGVNKVVA